MPIPLPNAPPNDRLEALLAAAEGPSPRGEPGVAPCPLVERQRRREEEARAKKPARLLFWNVFELGGGLFTPAERPTYAIDAYAKLIASLDLHVVVLAGLTRSLQKVPVTRKAGAVSYVALEDAPADSGPAEAKRILRKLQAIDGGSGWQLALPKDPQTGATLYDRWTTVAFLYASGKGFSFQKTDVIEAALAAEAGVTDSLVVATFSAPAYRSEPVRVMASLGLTTPERPWEQLRAATATEEREPTAPMPESAVVFLSTPGDAAESLRVLEDELDAEFLRPTSFGTVLGDDFWKVTTERHDGLLASFAAVDPADVRLQDGQMHWEALKPPEHPDAAERLPGFLADGMAIVHHLLTPPPVVQELRVVDLLAASLPPDRIARLRATPSAPTADGNPPPEQGALVAQRAAWREAAQPDREPPPDGEPPPDEDAANELAQCSYFSRALSRHWPLLAQLKLQT
jgi:hypothetical protein